MYDEAEGGYDVVHYDGALHADGIEIEGQWQIAGIWSGTFLMIRATGTGRRLAETEEPLEILRSIVSPLSRSGISPLSPRASALRRSLRGLIRCSAPMPTRRIATARPDEHTSAIQSLLRIQFAVFS